MRKWIPAILALALQLLLPILNPSPDSTLNQSAAVALGEELSESLCACVVSGLCGGLAALVGGTAKNGFIDMTE